MIRTIGIFLILAAVFCIFWAHAQAGRYTIPGAITIFSVTGDGIQYVMPETHNRFSQLEARVLLAATGHSPDYIITDFNSYVNSIALRGYILLVLAVLGFVIITTRYAWQIVKQKPQKTFLLIAGGIMLANALVFMLLFRAVEIDLWVPAFYPEGWLGYARLIFNYGQLGSRRFLQAEFAALSDLNFRANVAFGLGVVLITAQTCVPLGTQPKMS